MRILAVDTSTRSCSVAVVDGNDLLAEVTSGNGQTHSRHLMAMIDSVLGLAGLDLSMTDGLAFTCGPGSFTGLRIGISTILGLAAATRKPIVGISGLDALAMQAATPDMTICPLIDGRRNEVYCARYRWINGELVKEMAEQVLLPEMAISGVNTPANFAIGSTTCCSGTVPTAKLRPKRVRRSPRTVYSVRLSLAPRLGK